MKYLPEVIISLLISVFLFTPFVYAATEATVTTTVTAQEISLTVTDGNVSYGTLSLSATRSTIAAEENEMQTVTNNGNVNEDFDIKGQNSGAWTLASTQGANQYFHKFCNDTDNDCSTPGTNYTALTTDYQELDASVASSGTTELQLQIGMPSSTSSYTQQSVDVFVLASAAS